VSLLTTSKAQEKLAQNFQMRWLNTGLTQEGLATRSGVSVSTLRKFERTGGVVSLESFLKLAMVLGVLDLVVEATALEQAEFSSIDDVLKTKRMSPRKKGWRK